MKHIYIIGGTMGVGKTTTSQVLKKKLTNSVFLDGDWCWDMNPFLVNQETKQMVMENICFLLNNFILCSSLENIIFCWVLHEQSIIDHILAHINTTGCELHLISLVCSEDMLRIRLLRDVEAGIRKEDIMSRAIERIPLFYALRTKKVDVSHITPEQAADFIIEKC